MTGETDDGEDETRKVKKIEEKREKKREEKTKEEAKQEEAGRNGKNEDQSVP